MAFTYNNLECSQEVLIWFVFCVPEASNGFKVGRHNLSYIQEIGNGWFGQVICLSFGMTSNLILLLFYCGWVFVVAWTKCFFYANG